MINQIVLVRDSTLKNACYKLWNKLSNDNMKNDTVSGLSVQSTQLP